jgi:glycerate 2-kinase
MHILIAPNAFKNSLNAEKAAEAISKGLHESKLQCTTSCFPIADGGDGTGALLIRHLQGYRVPVTVNDPLGRRIDSSIGFIHGDRTAVIEMADASGLRLLQRHEYNPLYTTTFGTGELIREAMSRKVEKIIICIGGSATVDGGTGMLRALRVKFMNKEGSELNDLPASLSSLASVDYEQLLKLPSIPIVVLCDVDNLLLGDRGTAAMFGPQKGATASDIQVLENGLTRLRDVVLAGTGKDMALVKHGGAAGGIAASLYAFLNATLVKGIDHFLTITNFEKELEKTDLVITGEGSLDLQTLQGKGPFGVAEKAKKYSIPVVGMAGNISDESILLPYFTRLMRINDQDTDLETAMKNTYRNLERTARLLGDQLFLERQSRKE